jgi:hypothetical protein
MGTVRGSFLTSKLCLLLLAMAVLSVGIPTARAQCEPLPRGFAGWWPGDDTALDVTSPGNDGQLINGATFGTGVIGRAFSMDGVNDRVDVPDAPNLQLQRFTLAAWIKLDTLPAQSCIICKQFGSSTTNSYSLWLSGGFLRGGMFGIAEAVAVSAVPANQFVHTAVTWDGAIIRLYIDGVLIASAPGPVTPVPYDSNQVIIGADDNGVNAYAGFVDGIIDEAQIFDRALTACEIRRLFRSQPLGACKGDTDGDLIPDAQDNCPAVSNAAQTNTDGDGAGDMCDCAPTDPGVYANPGDRFLLGFDADDKLDWCRDPWLTGPSTVYDLLRGDLDDLPVTTGTSECRSRCLAPFSDLVGWWPGDGSTTDLVGGLNGTLENGATYGTGWVRSGFTFDGVNDRVRTGNLSLGDPFSVAAWVKSDILNQGAYRRIVETSNASHFYLGTDAVGTGYKFIVKNAIAPYGSANGGKISPDDWQLVVGTYDGTTGTLYVDGNAVASDTFSSPGVVSLPVNIGAYLGGGFGWRGQIDEVQIYDRVLSATEVRQMYEGGSSGQCKFALGGVDAEWTAPYASDATIPAPGQGFWYVYRGRNVCADGSYGFATSGAERISTVCD